MPAAEEPFRQRKQTPVHGIDPVALLQEGHAQATANRAMHVFGKVKTEGAGRVLLAAASPALESSGVPELLEETSMDPEQGFPAVGAFFHS